MDDQCALGLDGQLLGEPEIVWHHDPDDPSPIVPVTTPIHRFFTGGSSPALIVNGSRCSAWVPQPLKCVLDADNAERAGGSKCPRASRVTVVESDTEDPEGIVEPGETTDGNNVGTDVDLEMVDVDAAEDAYAVTKAMGDWDCDVGFFIFIYKEMYLIFYYQTLSNCPNLNVDYSPQYFDNWKKEAFQLFFNVCEPNFGRNSADVGNYPNKDVVNSSPGFWKQLM